MDCAITGTACSDVISKTTTYRARKGIYIFFAGFLN